MGAERLCVLLVEDEGALRGALELTLARAGFDAITAQDGRSGLRALYEYKPDVVVLDIGLPDMDGWAVLERIRELSDVPVLLLTARNLEVEKVRGLQSGADDYMTKPFGNAELVARISALARRGGRGGERERMLAHAPSGLAIDRGTREATLDGEPLDLTPLEFRILSALLEAEGRVLSANDLLELAWSDSLRVGPERVKFAVRRLRLKLGPAGEHVRTSRGFGYRL